MARAGVMAAVGLALVGCASATRAGRGDSARDTDTADPDRDAATLPMVDGPEPAADARCAVSPLRWDAALVPPSRAVAVASGDGGVCTFTAAPRPVAPTAGARVASRRPTLRWTLPAGACGAHVDVCLDRACTQLIASNDVADDHARTSVELPAGVLWWRLRGGEASSPSPIWQLRVPRALHADRPDAAHGFGSDFDGDGYDDLLRLSPTIPRALWIYRGGAAGLSTNVTWVIPIPLGASAGWATAVGDIDGDGLVEAAGYDQGRLVAWRIGDEPRLVSDVPISWRYTGALRAPGDVDIDGYTDVVSADDTDRLDVRRGGPLGLEREPSASLARRDTGSQADLTRVYGGDWNGDGAADILAGWSSHYWYSTTPEVLLGGTGGLHEAQDEPSVVGDFGSSGDFNGDGRADLVVQTSRFTYELRGTAYGLVQVDHPFSRNVVSDYAEVASVGDLDGDGYDDAAVLAGDLAMPGGVGIRIWRGGPDGLQPAEDAFAGAEPISAFLVDGAHDFDGDGYDDLAVMRSSPGGPPFAVIPGGPCGLRLDRAVRF